MGEIMDGKNVADFIDPDIDRKLAELEREEELLLKEEAVRNAEDAKVLGDWDKTQGILDEIHSRMRQKRLENRLNKSRTKNPVPRTIKKRRAKDVEEEATAVGVDGAKVRMRSTSRKRAASIVANTTRDVGATRGRSASAKGLPNEDTAQVEELKRRKKMRRLSQQGRKGEADRGIPDLKPKHLYSGKRGIGKTDRR